MIRQLTCSALLLLAMHAGAQDRRPPPKGPPMDEIATTVGLKDTQRASVQAILEQHHAAMMAMQEAMRSKHDALDQQLHASLAKVLTPDQLTRFDRWHETHRPPPPPDGHGGPGDRRGSPGEPGSYGYRPPRQQGPAGRGGGMQGGQGRRPPPPGGDGDRPPPPEDDGYDAAPNPPPPHGDQP